MTPRLIGHALAGLLGATAVIASVFAFRAGITPVLPVTLLIVGALMGGLTALSLQGSRAAWSFLVALCGVMFVCNFFGVPKIRSLVDTSFGFALLPSLRLGVTTVLLAVIYADYETAK